MIEILHKYSPKNDALNRPILSQIWPRSAYLNIWNVTVRSPIYKISYVLKCMKMQRITDIVTEIAVFQNEWLLIRLSDDH